MFFPQESALHRFLKKRGWMIFWAILLFFFAFFQVHNTFSYNPYWGYDGGGHIDYLFSLAKDHRFPLIKDNYIAWHEPLFYLVDAFFLKIFLVFTDDRVLVLKLLVLLQSVWSGLTLFFLYRISRFFLPVLLSTLILLLFSALPSFHAASLFITNELFAYLFAFLLSFLLVHRIKQGTFHRWDGWLFGGVMGLSLLSKITTIIPVAGCLLICLFLWKKRVSGINLRFFLLTILVLVALNAPWQIYRFQHIAQGPSLNNPSFLSPKPLSMPVLVKTLTRFDVRVFRIPYFPMGSEKMWPMLYADLVSDYYGILDNVDRRNATPKEQLFQTADFSWVGVRHSWYMKRLIWLGLSIAILILVGWGELIRRTVWGKRSDDQTIALYGILCSAGYLAAQMFYLYRYPYFDMGAVKAIFILPGFFFPMLYGGQVLYRGYQSGNVGRMGSFMMLVPLVGYVFLSYMAFFLPR